MPLHNLHNQEMSLVLSSDAKPRLKWTPELHHRFVDAVKHLGGLEKATPKSLMRVMDIHGLTLYHLKSHLQKYRLGRSQQSQSYHHNKQEDSGENQTTNKKCNAGEEQINDFQVKQALKMQMDVQRKLHQQIEVQRHLQLRIDAQGRYLQSVLKKAEETLSGYSPCSIEVEHARAQLSQLASMVDSGCTTSSFSVLTESDCSMLKEAGEKVLGRNGNGCSLESSLTLSETSKGKEKARPNNEMNGKRDFGEMEINPVAKRSKSSMDEGEDYRVKKNIIDLNELDSGPTPRGIDLNCNFASTF